MKKISRYLFTMHENWGGFVSSSRRFRFLRSRIGIRLLHRTISGIRACKLEHSPSNSLRSRGRFKRWLRRPLGNFGETIPFQYSWLAGLRTVYQNLQGPDSMQIPPPEPVSSHLRFARLADLTRLSVINAAGFYHTPVFTYKRPHL